MKSEGTCLLGLLGVPLLKHSSALQNTTQTPVLLTCRTHYPFPPVLTSGSIVPRVKRRGLECAVQSAWTGTRPRETPSVVVPSAFITLGSCFHSASTVLASLIMVHLSLVTVGIDS